MTEEPDPISYAAYFASVWGLSNSRMRSLEEAFRTFRDYYRPKTAVEVIRRMLQPDTIISAAELHPDGFERKEIYNALTYLTKTGELAHIGYGKYQSPPADPVMRMETSSEHIARNIREGCFPEMDEPQERPA